LPPLCLLPALCPCRHCHPRPVRTRICTHKSIHNLVYSDDVAVNSLAVDRSDQNSVHIFYHATNLMPRLLDALALTRVITLIGIGLTPVYTHKHHIDMHEYSGSHWRINTPFCASISFICWDKYAGRCRASGASSAYTCAYVIRKHRNASREVRYLLDTHTCPIALLQLKGGRLPYPRILLPGRTRSSGSRPRELYPTP
jgi:hypothetical protein